MLDFCGGHNVTADVEIIKLQQIDQAYERLMRNDVKYRFALREGPLAAAEGNTPVEIDVGKVGLQITELEGSFPLLIRQFPGGRAGDICVLSRPGSLRPCSGL